MRTSIWPKGEKNKKKKPKQKRKTFIQTYQNLSPRRQNGKTTAWEN